MIVEEACTRPLWEEHSKELNILFLNLINESERDFSTLAIKIHLKKKTRKRIWPDYNFRKFLIPKIF